MNIGGVGINYKEGDVSKYKAVRAHLTDVDTGKRQDRLFSTGDVVKDFEDADNWLTANGVESCSLSSDVDHFLMDDKKDVFYWDNAVALIRRSKDREQNEKSNRVLLLRRLIQQRDELNSNIAKLEAQIKSES